MPDPDAHPLLRFSRMRIDLMSVVRWGPVQGIGSWIQDVLY
ncbi:MAG: hypothetical protein ACFBSG_00875 [Leptolyngbyaceae cyanobacterium]